MTRYANGFRTIFPLGLAEAASFDPALGREAAEIAAREAAAIGLVNRVVPAEDVDTVALGYARALAAKPPEAVRTARRLMRGDILKIRLPVDLKLITWRITDPASATKTSPAIA